MCSNWEKTWGFLKRMDSSLTAVSCIIQRAPQSVRAFPFPYRWLLRSLSAFCWSVRASGLLWLGECRVGIVLAQLLTSQIQQFTVTWECTKIFNFRVSAARIWGKIFKNRQRSRKMRICRMYTAMFIFTWIALKRWKITLFPGLFHSWPDFLEFLQDLVSPRSCHF